MTVAPSVATKGTPRACPSAHSTTIGPVRQPIAAPHALRHEPLCACRRVSGLGAHSGRGQSLPSRSGRRRGLEAQLNDGRPHKTVRSVEDNIAAFCEGGRGALGNLRPGKGFGGGNPHPPRNDFPSFSLRRACLSFECISDQSIVPRTGRISTQGVQ